MKGVMLGKVGRLVGFRRASRWVAPDIALRGRSSRGYGACMRQIRQMLEKKVENKLSAGMIHNFYWFTRKSERLCGNGTNGLHLS